MSLYWLSPNSCPIPPSRFLLKLQLRLSSLSMKSSHAEEAGSRAEHAIDWKVNLNLSLTQANSRLCLPRVSSTGGPVERTLQDRRNILTLSFAALCRCGWVMYVSYRFLWLWSLSCACLMFMVTQLVLTAASFQELLSPPSRLLA